MAEEISRSDTVVYFKTMKALYLKGSEEDLLNFFETQVIEARVVSGNEIGRCVCCIQGLKPQKEVCQAVSVDIVGRNSVFLDFAVKLTQENLKNYKTSEDISTGVSILKLDEKTTGL